MSYRNISRTGTIGSLFCAVLLCTLGAQALTLPPDPNNAALLYYQAFLCQPETDYAEEQLVYNTFAEKIYDLLCGGELQFHDDIDEEILELEKRLNNEANEPDEIPFAFNATMPEESFEFETQFWLDELRKRREHEQKMRGIDPNETIRNYMKKCRETIELAQAASELSDCDWGIRYSRGGDPGAILLTRIRRFALMFRADALVHAANGDYRTAFEQCLMIRRFARHIGDDTQLLYVVSKTVDRVALREIQFLLGCHKPKVETLTWLKSQLAIKKDNPLSLTKVLKTDFELALQDLRNNTEMLDKARQAMRLKGLIIVLSNDERTPKDGDDGELRSITVEELLTLAGKPYADFLDSALQVINSGMSYEEKYSEIQSLTEKIENEYGGDPASFPVLAAHPEKMLTLPIVMLCAEAVSGLYKLNFEHTASYNILMTGIEVYLIMAQTGQLPEQLPQGVPKDPFTGRDFTYEITEDGFTLSLPDKNTPAPDRRVPRQNKPRPYEFKVKK